MLIVSVVKVSESPVCMITDEASCIDNPNVPDVAADQNDMSVSVSGLVPPHDVHSGSSLALMLPADADPHVTASRVVVEETLLVPAEPGAPVCSWT
jgi:hypothetical protein